jgi:hypothetical protein
VADEAVLNRYSTKNKKSQKTLLLTAEARERAVKAIAFAKLLRKDLEVAAEFSFLADSGAVLERLHFTGHVQVEYINVSSERIFGCGPGTFRTSNINKVAKNTNFWM